MYFPMIIQKDPMFAKTFLQEGEQHNFFHVQKNNWQTKIPDLLDLFFFTICHRRLTHSFTYLELLNYHFNKYGIICAYNSFSNHHYSYSVLRFQGNLFLMQHLYWIIHIFIWQGNGIHTGTDYYIYIKQNQFPWACKSRPELSSFF
jgi:hypothetical protein